MLKSPIAYLSMEFGLDDFLPIFAGGLGILAGDILLEASDQNMPFIGIGLFYHKGYLQQQITKGGEQTEGEFHVEAETAKLTLIPKLISVPLADRQVKVKAWLKTVGNSKLYLLDTHVEGNSSDDYHICNGLYSGDKEHRFKQELILGVGAVNLLTALNITPHYYHLNEAHCSLAIIQQVVNLKQKNPSLSLPTALDQIKQKTVFTNHTIVPEGNDVFSEDLASIYLAPYAQLLKTPLPELINLGKVADAAMFSMPLLALRHSIRSNAVSLLHGKIADKSWPDFSFIPITNGIYLPRWLNSSLAKVWPLNKKTPCTPVEFWHSHQKQKTLLLELVKDRTGVQLDVNVLTITWARRITSYKRPDAVLKDMKRFEAILSSTDRPIQFLMAGKVHPRDETGKQFVKRVHGLCKQGVCNHRFQFIPNYDIKVAQALIGGSDIWLNTPLRGYEACGTSGMKACLNGVLQMTTEDGWTDNVEWAQLGWTLDSENVSENIYSLLEGSVADSYFNKNNQGFSPQWVDRMLKSSQLIRQNYSATRMLNEYQQKLYL